MMLLGCYTLGGGFGLYLEGGAGYNADQNVGLGYVVTVDGAYTGIGTGMIFGEIDSEYKLALGVNIDFLIDPEMSFVRGEERYDIHNMADRASLRFMPYMAFSKMVVDDWLYIGLGLGYSNTGLYFGMRPILYDKEYTSYHLSSDAVTPLFFLRAYFLEGFYISFNYEADIVVSGELKRLAGDPLAGFNNIDGSTDIKGIHHRARIVVGYTLGIGY